MCYKPLTIDRDRTEWFNQVSTNVVPCGKCPKCLRSRQQDWLFRLTQEMYISESTNFLTLTYEDTPLSFNGLPTLKKKDIQDFWKKLRKRYPPKTIKYYSIGEYGFHHKRPHYHAIIYNLDKNDIYRPDNLDGVWDKGHVDLRPVNGNRMGYVTGYCMQGVWKPEHDYDDRNPHFAAQSKHLGRSYIEDPEILGYYKSNLFAHYNDQHIQRKLPRYYLDRMFTPHERKIIANKLARKVEPLEERFDNANHLITWIKDQDRKHESLLRKRQKL